MLLFIVNILFSNVGPSGSTTVYNKTKNTHLIRSRYIIEGDITIIDHKEEKSILNEIKRERKIGSH